MAVEEMQNVAVLTDSGPNPKFHVSQTQIPTPGPNEFLVRLSCSSVCGSDLSMAHGHLGVTTNVLGHEGVGHIVAAGSNAAYLAGIPAEPSPVGRRVAIALLRDICGACDYCCAPPELAAETRCSAKIFSGLTMEGTFAQYVLVRARYAQLLPPSLDSVPDETVAPILCGGVTAYKALKLGGAEPGAWVAVSGAGGGVGALGVAYARAMGCRVVGVDVGESKRAYVLEQGAEAYVDVTAAADVAAEVKRVTGGPGAAVVVVASGAAAAYQAALGMLGPYGTLVCVGIPVSGEITFSPFDIMSHGHRIIGSLTGSRADVLQALDFAKRGLVKPKIKWAKLEDLPRIMDELRKGDGEGKYIIDLK